MNFYRAVPARCFGIAPERINSLGYRELFIRRRPADAPNRFYHWKDIPMNFLSIIKELWTILAGNMKMSTNYICKGSHSSPRLKPSGFSATTEIKSGAAERTRTSNTLNALG